MFMSSVHIPRNVVLEHDLLSRPAIKNFLHTLFPLAMDRQFIYKLKPSTVDGQMSLLVISSDEPIKLVNAVVTTKQIPESYLNATRYQFHLDTIPTKQYKNTRTQHNLYREDEIRQWFVEKAQRYGFSVSPEQIDIRDIKQITINKRGHEWKLPKVTISGILTVVDQTRFMKTIYEGFGDSRCFGFGLIELKRV